MRCKKNFMQFFMPLKPSIKNLSDAIFHLYIITHWTIHKFTLTYFIYFISRVHLILFSNMLIISDHKYMHYKMDKKSAFRLSRKMAFKFSQHANINFSLFILFFFCFSAFQRNIHKCIAMDAVFLLHYSF